MADACLMRSDIAHYNIHREVNLLAGWGGGGGRRVLHLIGYKFWDLDPTRQYLMMEIEGFYLNEFEILILCIKSSPTYMCKSIIITSFDNSLLIKNDK